MIKEFNAIIQLTPDECKHIILHDLRHVRAQILISRMRIFGESILTSDHEFHITIWRGQGTLMGTIRSLDQDKTEVKGQLRVSQCYRINIPIAIFLIIVVVILTMTYQETTLCIFAFIFVALPFLTMVSHIICNQRESTNQRIIDIFIETLRGQSSSTVP